MTGTWGSDPRYRTCVLLEVEDEDEPFDGPSKIKGDFNEGLIPVGTGKFWEKFRND